MLIKRTERQARRGSSRSLRRHSPARGLDRRTFLRRSGLAAGGLAALGTLPLTAVRKAEAGPPTAHGARSTHPQEHLHALRGRLHGDGRSRQRRVDRPGAELGQPDQSRLALRQGCVGARTRFRRAASQISDEARRMANGLASPGTRPSTRSATS